MPIERCLPVRECCMQSSSGYGLPFGRRIPTYDFTKSKPNPYVRTAKRQITIRLDVSTIDYFKDLSKRSGIPYQNLINLYLRDCASEKKRLKLDWAA
jgi:hypothetical protein